MEKKCIGIIHKNYDLEELSFGKEIEFTEHGFLIPDSFGIAIGKRNIKTGKLISLLKKDNSNGNIDFLEQALEKLTLVEKVYHTFDKETNALEDWVYYHIMYDVKESTKNIPTCLSGDVYGRVLTGHYKHKYEVVLSTEESSVRFSFYYSSVNISMYQLISNFEDFFSEALENECEIEEFNQLITIEKDDDVKYIHMYDEVGERFDIEISSVHELLSYISSIRCIGCEFIDD